jgi:multiple sugar transport system substrate-binding protein
MAEEVIFSGQSQVQPQDGSLSVEQREKTSFNSFPILKILLGLLVLFVVLFVIFVLIVPRFIGGKQKVTLTYWGLFEDSQVVGPVIQDFERENPNIHVDYVREDIKQYKERLLTRIKNGTGPDVFTFHNTWYSMLSSVLLPLPESTIGKGEFTKYFYPVASRDLIKNGAIYGIPLEIDTLALYINSDMFQKAGLNPPSDWNAFLTDAKTLTVKDQNGKIQTSGAALGSFDNITHAPDIISLLMLQNGTSLENISGTSKRASDALNFYTSFALPGANVWDSTLDPSIVAFERGKLAMYFGYSWDFFLIKAQNSNLNFSIVKVPQLPGANVTLASYWADGVSLKSKNQKEALLFMKFLSRKDTEEKLYAQESKIRFFGEPYARVDLGDKLKDNPNVYPFVSQGKDAFSSFFASDTYDDGLNSQMNAYLGNSINSILNQTSPDTALTTLSQGVSQVLQQYGK